MKPLAHLRTILFSLSLAAASSSVYASMQQLDELFRSGNSVAAYKLSQQMLADFEGQPEFDFILGASSIDQGQYKEGVFALERALLTAPQNQLLKLELARGYFYLGNAIEAQRLFDEVLTSSPALPVRKRIENYTNAMDAKALNRGPQLKGFIEFWIGSDSNVNSGPADQPSVVTLGLGSLESSDAFFQTGAGIKFDYAYSNTRMVNARLLFADRNYEDVAGQDTAQFSATIEHGWRSIRRDYLAGVNLERYKLGDMHYRDLSGVYLQWDEKLSQQSLIRSTLSLNNLRYPDVTYRDSAQWMLNSTYIRSLPGRWNPTWYLGGFIGAASPERSTILSEAEIHRDFLGLNAGVQLNLTEKLSLTPSFIYQEAKFNGESWLYSKKRVDRFYGPSVRANFQLNDTWSLGVNLSAVRNSSNIDLYNFERTQLMLGTRFTFE
ncbi:MAG: DUF560 domain-containing protein [Oceanospirillaceae bacterium]|nr:DUF560 domain-containing protein [Oceanospirillaceae bacterium]